MPVFLVYLKVIMRLDKFLKVSRLVKRRTVANSISELGRVFVNGTIAKPAKQLKVGDIIMIEYANNYNPCFYYRYGWFGSCEMVSEVYHLSQDGCTERGSIREQYGRRKSP